MKIRVAIGQGGESTSTEELVADKIEIKSGDTSKLASLASKRSVRSDSCIYCGSTDSLSREHVIPYALGGNLQIFQGSCGKCRKITSRFEDFALNDGAMAEVRKIRGIQSRSSHSSARAAIRVGLLKNGQLMDTEVDTQDVPLPLAFPWFPEPGMLRGQGQSELSLLGLVTTSFGPEIDEFLRKNDATELHIKEDRKHAVAFAQAMAKIAYGYAWIDGIFEFLQGGADLVKAFMGADCGELGGFVGMKPPPFEHFPGLDFRLEYRLKAPELLVYMEVQPFPNTPAPTYLVVLGKCKDLRTWRHARRRMASGFGS